MNGDIDGEPYNCWGNVNQCKTRSCIVVAHNYAEYKKDVMNIRMNIIIDGKKFFDLRVKTEEKAYKKIINMSNNNDYTTGNLLDFACFKKNYSNFFCNWFE